MQALLSDEASNKLVDSLLEILSDKIDDMLIQKQKRYIHQDKLYEEYNCNFRDVERWLSLGLPRRRQGTKWIYDRKDIEEIFLKEKVSYN